MSAACSAPFGFMIAVFFSPLSLTFLSAGGTEGGGGGTEGQCEGGRRLAGVCAALARPSVSGRAVNKRRHFSPFYLFPLPSL